jgi:hypothetical protein
MIPGYRPLLQIRYIRVYRTHEGLRREERDISVSGSDNANLMEEPRTTMVYALAGLAAVFALGAILQLYLVGLSTFDSGRYWSDHVFLGRLIGLPALALPVIAVFSRLGRTMIVFSVTLAVLYVVQTMLTHIGGGPMGALHAINSVPLIGIPIFVGLRSIEALRERANGGDGQRR